MRILETAVNRGINFRVIIADSRPQQYGGSQFLRFLIYQISII